MSARRRSSLDGGVDNARNVSSKKMQYSQQELDRRAARQVAAAGRAAAEHEAQKRYTESIPAPTTDDSLVGARVDMAKQKAKMLRNQRNLGEKTITTKSGKEMKVSAPMPKKDPKPGTKTSKDVPGKQKVTRKVKKTSLKEGYKK